MRFPTTPLDTDRAINLPGRVNGAAIIRKERMIKIYSPTDELELAMIRGVLDSEGVHYFVHNDHFGSMRVGPQIDLLNKKTIMVSPEDVERAKTIISDLINRELPEETIEEKYTATQKLRMILEAIVFGWFIPGRKRRRMSPEKEDL